MDGRIYESCMWMDGKMYEDGWMEGCMRHAMDGKMYETCM
jgi:hypothetical protein